MTVNQLVYNFGKSTEHSKMEEFHKKRAKEEEEIRRKLEAIGYEI